MYFQIEKTYIENRHKFQAVIVERDDGSQRVFSQKHGEQFNFIFLSDEERTYSINKNGMFE